MNLVLPETRMGKCRVLVHVPSDCKSPEIPIVFVLLRTSIETDGGTTDSFMTQMDAPVSSKNRIFLSLFTGICTYMPFSIPVVQMAWGTWEFNESPPKVRLSLRWVVRFPRPAHEVGQCLPYYCLDGNFDCYCGCCWQRI